MASEKPGPSSCGALLRPHKSTDSSSSSSTGSDVEDTFLRACRNGDMTTIKDMLEKLEQNLFSFNISCKGQSKSNLGWTPLHLATYFGHKDVAEQLLSVGAEVNALNDNGDTPLHKASFIGREDLVMLLIQYNADVTVINGEGRLPRDVTPANEVGDEISKLLQAAETTESLRKGSRLLACARDGDVETLGQLLKDPNPPNINFRDHQGNTSLHCAAYRGHKEAAVLLLQNGIDTQIRNNRDQRALDLARDAQTLQVLSVKSARRVEKKARWFEGPLLKRSRFLGWKPVWAVLDRGVLTYFSSRADATGIPKRKDFKYMDSAKVSAIPSDLSSFVIHFNDGAIHRLCVVNNGGGGAELSQVERQKWINALNEHTTFSQHYSWEEEEKFEKSIASRMKPLGCMTDALGSASASFEVLQRQMGDCATMVEALQKSMDSSDCSSGLPVSALMVGQVQMSYLRFQLVSETSANMMASLQHCLTLFHQQEDVRVLQLKQEQEKCRVLEEALNVLAKEHHELEQSVASHISETGTIPHNFSFKSSRIFDTDEEFCDAFDGDSDTDTLVQTESIFNTPSGSVLTLLEDGDVGEGSSCVVRRNRRRVLRRRSSGGTSRELLSGSTNTISQYFTDEGASVVSHTESTSSTESSSSSSSSSGGNSTTNASSHHQSQSTSSYYTQQCDVEDHGEEQEEDHRRLVVDGEEEVVGIVQDDDSHRTTSDKSESNSSSDTLVGTLSNATSCATLSEAGGGGGARCDVFYDNQRSEKDLICLKTPVRRR